MDMQIVLFAEQSYGQIALKKIAPTEPNFRLYKAGWIGRSHSRDVMEVTGAVFRHALSAPNKGRLSILVPKTSRSVNVTAAEMKAFEAVNAGHPQVPA